MAGDSIPAHTIDSTIINIDVPNSLEYDGPGQSGRSYGILGRDVSYYFQENRDPHIRDPRSWDPRTALLRDPSNPSYRFPALVPIYGDYVEGTENTLRYQIPPPYLPIRTHVRERYETLFSEAAKALEFTHDPAFNMRTYLPPANPDIKLKYEIHLWDNYCNGRPYYDHVAETVCFPAFQTGYNPYEVYIHEMGHFISDVYGVSSSIVPFHPSLFWISLEGTADAFLTNIEFFRNNPHDPAYSSSLSPMRHAGLIDTLFLEGMGAGFSRSLSWGTGLVTPHTPIWGRHINVRRVREEAGGLSTPGNSDFYGSGMVLSQLFWNLLTNRRCNWSNSLDDRRAGDPCTNPTRLMESISDVEAQGFAHAAFTVMLASKADRVIQQIGVVKQFYLLLVSRGQIRVADYNNLLEVLRDHHYEMTSSPNDNINLSQYSQVGSRKDGCDREQYVYVRLGNRRVRIAPGDTRIFDRGYNAKTLEWFCGDSEEGFEQDPEFRIVRVSRASNGAISWTLYRERMTSTVSDNVNLSQYDQVGSRRDACDKFEYVYISLGNRTVRMAPGESRIFDRGYNAKALNWRCGFSNEDFEQDQAFRIIQVSRASNGAISWTFYREKMTSTVSDNVNLSGYSQVGTRRDGCDKYEYVYIPFGNRTVRIAPGNTRVFDRGFNSKTLSWRCGYENEFFSKDIAFRIIRISRASNGAISWTFYREKMTSTGSDNVNLSNFLQVGSRQDGCDKYEYVHIPFGNRTVRIAPGHSRTFDRGYNTRSLNWRCGTSNEGFQQSQAFRIIRVSRASNGAISWRFYREKPTSTPSDIREEDFFRLVWTRYIPVGSTRDACDRNEYVYFRRNRNNVRIAAGDRRIFDLGYNVRTVNWRCGNSDERFSNGTPFRIIQVSRSSTGAIEWTLYQRRY